jgi:hypothetical protein
MVATDLGVYVLNNGSSIWSNYSLGLPNVIVSDIEFNAPLNKIYVSTFGRGIWETNLSLVTGLQEYKNTQPLNFNVYPSVNNGKFLVELVSYLKTKITVIDVLGRTVYMENPKELKSEIQLQVLPGTYYVRVESDQLLGVKKIIIE